MPMLKKNNNKRPKPKVPHLAFPPGLGSEDRCAIPLRLSKVILHALIGFREAQDKPNDRGSRLKEIP